jgi:hypothetical protein
MALNVNLDVTFLIADDWKGIWNKTGRGDCKVPTCVCYMQITMTSKDKSPQDFSADFLASADLFDIDINIFMSRQNFVVLGLYCASTRIGDIISSCSAGFLSLSKQDLRHYLKSGNYRFLPHIFTFIIHLEIRRCTAGISKRTEHGRYKGTCFCRNTCLGTCFPRSIFVVFYPCDSQKERGN